MRASGQLHVLAALSPSEGLQQFVTQLQIMGYLDLPIHTHTHTHTRVKVKLTLEQTMNAQMVSEL